MGERLRWIGLARLRVGPGSRAYARPPSFWCDCCWRTGHSDGCDGNRCCRSSDLPHDFRPPVVVYFRTHLSNAGEALRYWGNKLLECVMQSLKPAHTILHIAYGSYQPMLQPDDELSIRLKARQWNEVLTVLSDGPFRIVAPLIQAIRDQGMAQDAAGQPNGAEDAACSALTTRPQSGPCRSHRRSGFPAISRWQPRARDRGNDRRRLVGQCPAGRDPRSRRGCGHHAEKDEQRAAARSAERALCGEERLSRAHRRDLSV